MAEGVQVRPNACSIGLRIDYCKSSVLFTGDASSEEEAALDTGGVVSLLQVAHHGSNTSTSEAFVAQAKPKYAVISSGKKDEGTNKGYCHPLKSTVDRLTNATGGAGSKVVEAFDALVTCNKSKPENWVNVPTSDNLWVTARDGNVMLTTTGDGTFTRVQP
jgi:competence protein ComEC